MKIPSSFLLLLAVGPLLGSAQTYPLSENTWSNPDFVARLMRTHGFDTERTPSITSEEKAMFETIAPLISSNPSQTITDLPAVLTPESSAALVYTLANLYFQSDDLESAEATYRDAIKKFPNFLRAYRNLGIVYVQEAKFEEATPMLLKAIELGGQGADLYGMLTYSYLRIGNTEAALPLTSRPCFSNPPAVTDAWARSNVS
ncbi:MAG: tetratricopeptide repeat protein [Candidatus Synoicihabitans palmerolidicus]|nr:tetratricopeptide repeat protein [Candidatus Synoicihabitans palmerolidicus]